jgi:hypothetical protein
VQLEWSAQNCTRRVSSADTLECLMSLLHSKPRNNGECMDAEHRTFFVFTAPTRFHDAIGSRRGMLEDARSAISARHTAEHSALLGAHTKVKYELAGHWGWSSLSKPKCVGPPSAFAECAMRCMHASS